MTKNEAIQAAHHWQQRAEDAEKFAAGLELNLAAVIQRAEAAEGYLAELSPRYADIVAERAQVTEARDKLLSVLECANKTARRRGGELDRVTGERDALRVSAENRAGG